MQKATREMQLEEAAKRLKMLNIFAETARQFLEDGRLSYSYGPLAACYRFQKDDLEAIREFEKNTGALVYFAIRNDSICGTMDALLYVSNDSQVWEADQIDLKHGEAYAYVLNRLEPAFSDLGMIGFRRGPAAGLIRTY